MIRIRIRDRQFYTVDVECRSGSNVAIRCFQVSPFLLNNFSKLYYIELSIAYKSILQSKTASSPPLKVRLIRLRSPLGRRFILNECVSSNCEVSGAFDWAVNSGNSGVRFHKQILTRTTKKKNTI